MLVGQMPVGMILAPDRYFVLRRAETTSQKGRLDDGLATPNTLKESEAWLHYDRSGLNIVKKPSEYWVLQRRYRCNELHGAVGQVKLQT